MIDSAAVRDPCVVVALEALPSITCCVCGREGVQYNLSTLQHTAEGFNLGIFSLWLFANSQVIVGTVLVQF
jgi:hypothetical protein